MVEAYRSQVPRCLHRCECRGAAAAARLATVAGLDALLAEPVSVVDEAEHRLGRIGRRIELADLQRMDSRAVDDGFGSRPWAGHRERRG